MTSPRPKRGWSFERMLAAGVMVEIDEGGRQTKVEVCKGKAEEEDGEEDEDEDED